jgi:hypothetical protein
MTLEEINYIAQTIGVLAILTSLVFVAIQTRQNGRTMRAQAVWDAQSSFAEINDMLAAGGPIGEASFKAFTNPGSVTPYERYLLHRLFRGVMQRTEAQYALYANGILDAEVWSLRRGYIKSLMSVPHFAEVWQTDKANSMFTRAFMAEIEQAEARDAPTFLGADATAGAEKTAP